jgi:glycosyltransferase involved in cell wall biosynthesis
MPNKPNIIQDRDRSGTKRNSSLPIVTVIIINLNQGHYLRDCLNSVVNQSYQNIEIVFQDGNSSDNSKIILNGFPQVMLNSEKDLSSSHAFAKATGRAKGKYLFFLCSSDGFYSENWIANAVSILEEMNTVSMVTGSVVGVDSESNLISYFWPEKNRKSLSPKTNFYSWLFDGFGFTPITFGIRADVLRSCAMPADKFLPPEDDNSVDFFWNLSENFFSRGFISIRSEEVASFVRIHTDRVDDSKYLPRQLSQLHSFIVNFRKELLLGRRKYDFVNPEGQKVAAYELKVIEIWIIYVLSKFRHLLDEKSKKIYPNRKI